MRWVGGRVWMEGTVDGTAKWRRGWVKYGCVVCTITYLVVAWVWYGVVHFGDLHETRRDSGGRRHLRGM